MSSWQHFGFFLRGMVFLGVLRAGSGVFFPATVVKEEEQAFRLQLFFLVVFQVGESVLVVSWFLFWFFFFDWINCFSCGGWRRNAFRVFFFFLDENKGAVKMFFIFGLVLFMRFSGWLRSEVVEPHSAKSFGFQFFWF